MIPLNTFELYIEDFKDEEVYVKHGISFSNCLFVKLIIDEQELDKKQQFDESAIVFDELRKSALNPGNYLIFTCICGIAEDGGWEEVEVKHCENLIIWNMEVDDQEVKYIFDKVEYVKEVNQINEVIINTQLTIEPSQVIFP